jgi:hypothetical protein
MTFSLNYRANAPHIVPELWRNIMRMPQDYLLQSVVWIATLKDRNCARDHRGRSTHPSATVNESRDSIAQQENEHLDGTAQYGRRTLLAIQDWEAAINQASGKHGHQLLSGEVNYRTDTSLHNAIYIARVCGVSEPQLG